MFMYNIRILYNTLYTLQYTDRFDRALEPPLRVEVFEVVYGRGEAAVLAYTCHLYTHRYADNI